MAEATQAVPQPNGSVVYYDLTTGDPVSEVTADGWNITFNHGQAATAARNGEFATIARTDAGGQTWTFADKSSVTFDAAGHVVQRVTPDGWVLSKFVDGQATRAAKGDVSADIAAVAGGGETWTYSDRSSVTFDAAGHVVQRVTADGWVLSKFVDGHATRAAKGDVSADIAAAAGGGETWTYSDRSSVTFDAAGHVVQRVTPDGWVLSKFVDGQATRAAKGDVSADIAAAAGGGETWTYSDRSSVTFDAAGHVVQRVTADGWVLSKFVDGQATRAAKGDVSADIAAAAGGGETWTYSDKSSVTFDANHNIVREVTPDGWTLSDYKDGHPTQAAKAGVTATITQVAGGGETWTFSDKSSVTYDAENHIVREVTPDGWTLSDYKDGHPTLATKDGKTVHITPAGNGGETWAYEGGPTITYDKDRRPVLMTTPDGWTYNQFNQDGKPTAGFKGKETVTISYPNGNIQYNHTNNPDGVNEVVTKQDGTIIYEWVNIPDADGNMVNTKIVISTELDNMQTSIATMKREAANLTEYLGVLKSIVQLTEWNWESPSGRRYAALNTDIEIAYTDLSTLLAEAGERMQKTWQNYKDTEAANARAYAQDHRQ
ncbi:hypothetical protein [Dactylosporangium sp. CA-233914]|uniref:hypothetical protein n=1 Tax=Dactylosporangium sp. CA-233914 TaxID=3239934 RepID=UPI003D8E6D8F